MSYYEIGGVTQLPGAATIGSATVVPALSVSAPSMGYLNGSQNEVWFRLTATATGNLLFDATLTLDLATQAADPYVTVMDLFSGGSGATTLADLSFLQEGLTIEEVVAAGTTYYVRISKPATDFVTAMILRVSDYAVASDWFQDPDQQWVIVPPVDATPVNDLPQPINIGNSLQPNHIPDYVPSVGGHYGLGFNQVWNLGFKGHYNTLQTFGGPEPGSSGDARNCMWHWARLGNWGTQRWGLFPDGTASTNFDYPSTWNGTGPVYDPSVPGGGTCLSHIGTPDSSDGVNAGNVAVQFTSDISGGFAAKNANYFSFAPCSRLNLTKVQTDATPSGGASYPDPPPGFETASLEWEDPTCEVTGLDIAPDELLLGDRSGSAGVNTVDFEVQWYVSATPEDENPLEFWGPDRINGKWWGSSSRGPEGLGLTSEVTVPPYSGGVASWQALSSTTVSDALAYEAAGAEYGLRGIALSPVQLIDFEPIVVLGTGGENIVYQRADQILSYRVHLRPSRYRWIPVPLLPEVTPLVSTIDGLPEDERVRFIG